MIASVWRKARYDVSLGPAYMALTSGSSLTSSARPRTHQVKISATFAKPPLGWWLNATGRSLRGSE